MKKYDRRHILSSGRPPWRPSAIPIDDRSYRDPSQCLPERYQECDQAAAGQTARDLSMGGGGGDISSCCFTMAIS